MYFCTCLHSHCYNSISKVTTNFIEILDITYYFHKVNPLAIVQPAFETEETSLIQRPP